MYLAVKLWRNTPDKPLGMPDAWPSEVKELGKLREVPSPEWLLMTSEDYACYIKARKDIYTQWAKSNVTPSTWKDPDEVEE